MQKKLKKVLTGINWFDRITIAPDKKANDMAVSYTHLAFILSQDQTLNNCFLPKTLTSSSPLLSRTPSSGFSSLFPCSLLLSLLFGSYSLRFSLNNSLFVLNFQGRIAVLLSRCCITLRLVCNVFRRNCLTIPRFLCFVKNFFKFYFLFLNSNHGFTL